MQASVATPSWSGSRTPGRSGRADREVRRTSAAWTPPERSTICLLGVVSPRRSSASSVGFAASCRRPEHDRAALVAAHGHGVVVEAGDLGRGAVGPAGRHGRARCPFAEAGHGRPLGRGGCRGRWSRRFVGCRRRRRRRSPRRPRRRPRRRRSRPATRQLGAAATEDFFAEPSAAPEAAAPWTASSCRRHRRAGARPVRRWPAQRQRRAREPGSAGGRGLLLALLLFLGGRRRRHVDRRRGLHGRRRGGGRRRP